MHGYHTIYAGFNRSADSDLERKKPVEEAVSGSLKSVVQPPNDHTDGKYNHLPTHTEEGWPINYMGPALVNEPDIGKFLSHHFTEGGEHFQKPHAWSDLDSDLTFAHHEKMPSDHEMALQDYTDDSEDMNAELHKNFGDLSKTPDIKSRADNLSNIIDKYKAPQDMHVYSGLAFNPEKFTDNTPEDAPAIHGHLNAFTSTSLNPGVAQTFAKKDRGMHDDGHNHMLSIHVPEGSRGLYAGDKSTISSEKEYILNRDAKVHIHPVPTVVHKTSYLKSPLSFSGEPRVSGDKPAVISKFKVWHARLVHDGTEPTRHMGEEERKNYE